MKKFDLQAKNVKKYIKIQKRCKNITLFEPKSATLLLTKFRNGDEMRDIIGHVSSVETMGTVDGPGVRYVLFMQGCNLRCKYCHNPETWALDGKALNITPGTMIRRILRYKSYMSKDGGVTISGGEPLLQPAFVTALLKLCKFHGMHTAIDTAGVGIDHISEILDNTDLVILDVKATDEESYRNITGHSMQRFNEFLKILDTKPCKVWLRQVIVPGINDTEENVLNLKEFAKKIKNVEKIELLGYHTLGVSKYEKLKIPYPLKDVPEMDDQKLEKLQKLLK